MKRCHIIPLLKTLGLLAALPAFSGCSYYVWAFMRNASESAVLVKLTWKYPNQRLPGFLPYSPRLLAPTYKNIKLLRDSLPVNATATTISFRLPPHATVLLDGGSQFKILRLQRADSSVQVLDSAQLVKAIQRRMIGGARLWYDIEAKNN